MRLRVAALCSLPLLLSLALGLSERPARAAGGELNLFIWSEYIDPDVVADFEKQTGIKVKISLFESNDEAIAKLQTGGGVSQYDLVVPSNNVIPQMVALDLLQPLDHSKIPNFKNLMAQFKDPPFDKGNKYSVAYLWGTEGILYRKDKHPNLDPSWSVIFDEKKQPGPFLLIDEMRDMLGIALKYLGHSTNSTSAEEIKKAGELVLAAKKSSKALGFEGGVGGKNKVLAEVADLAIVYNGDAIRALDEDERVGFMVPKEGSILWVDLLVIPKKAPNPEAAHQFINFILDPEAGARNANFIRYATPNEAALPKIEPKDRENPAIYPSDEVLKSLEYGEDVGEASRIYDEVWTSVKSR
jgi:spermidine/putrescine transport system substrate-binding protein